MTHISRSKWGARAGRSGPGRLDPNRVEGIALHWPGMASPLSNVNAVSAALRNWQAFHMDSKGWSDIAYQEAVDQAGNIYRLRGLRVQSGANGDTDVNERFGALLLVLAIGERPSAKMIKAAQGRIRRHQEIFPRSHRIVGHRDIRPEPTDCPGDLTTRLISEGAFNPTRKAPR